MSDELKPRESVDSEEFRALADNYADAEHGIAMGFVEAIKDRDKRLAALIAHINAWGARLAGDAAKDAERYRWLRDKCPDFEAMTSAWLYDELDKAIDAAIGEPPCGS